ncbi:MAG: site-2 protease family protein [Candidatus Gracilibacteria bacterium]|nr:site-2 protease family protein [Candidatus Gracilibacteria bacterium]
MIIIGIIVSIIIFSIVVLIHELGHFTAARKFGVKVEEFGLGIPPRAKKLFIDKKGTLFSLNWLPLGGFVKLTGETPNTFLVYDKNKKLYNNLDLENDLKKNKDIFYKSGEKIGKQEKEEILKLLEENNSSYNLANKPSWQQAIIMLAGIFMNFVLAFFIFFILFLVGIKPIGINDKIEISLDLKIIPTKEQAIESGLLIKKTGVILYPISGSIAENSGLKEGDILNQVYTCNSKMIDYADCEGGEKANILDINIPQELTKIIIANVGKDIAFYINAGKIGMDGEKGYVGGSFIKISIPNEGKIGTYIGENIKINDNYILKYNIVDSGKYAFLETKNQILLTFKGIGILVKKIFNPETPVERQEAIQSLSGPIGIVDFINNSLSAGFIFLIIIGAIISINLGVFNLLPIPALDGGRFIFILINSTIKKIFGKKAINEKIENIIHFSFFVLLIALSLIIAYNDINKIFNN